LSSPKPVPLRHNPMQKPLFNGNPTNYRYTVTFEKVGPARFLGHLDLQTLFHRALLRAKLPASYSQGYNPHLLVSFAQPLPLGMTSRVELLDIEMDETVDPHMLVTRLNVSLPDGLKALSAELMPLGSKSMASMVSGALYEMDFPDSEAMRTGLSAAVAAMLGSAEIVIDKKTKKGSAPADIRPDIDSLEDISTSERIAVRAVLATGSYRNLKPEFVARWLCAHCGAEFHPFAMQYARLALYLDGRGDAGDETDSR